LTGIVRLDPRRAPLVLGMLSAFGPLSMDLYLPHLPQLARDFGASDAIAQATMSACMIGLGLGQLFNGPLSDRFGRRRPLLIGVAIFTVLSAVCAVAPTIEVLLVARVLQGLAGSAGMVVCLAIARDLLTGTELSRMLSMLLLVSGTAPVVAPLIGGQLVYVMDWRGVFWVLTGIGTALTALVIAAVPETLAIADRHAGGLRALGANVSVVLRDRLFVAVLVTAAAIGVAFFSYLSMSSFVFEVELGLTPQMFSVVFAAAALASMGGGLLSRAVVRSRGPLAIYLIGTVGGVIASAALLLLVLLGASALSFAAAIVVFMFANGISNPNGQTLALSRHGGRAGTAAALIGMATITFGPIVAPLAALGGATAQTMAVTMTAASAVATLTACVWVARVARPRP